MELRARGESGCPVIAANALRGWILRRRSPYLEAVADEVGYVVVEPVPTIWIVEQAQVFSPGASIGATFSPGADEGEVFVPGAAEGEVR